MANIGAQIKQLRKEKRMTQLELAERLGVTKSAISAYENGSRLPAYDILVKMARIFKVSVDTILDYTDKNHIMLDVTGLTPKQVTHIREMTEIYRDFNEIQHAMPSRHKGKAIDFEFELD